MVDPEDRRLLLKAARDAVATRLRREPFAAPGPGRGILRERLGVFVSVYSDGELRGCIGLVRPAMPLIEAVISCAVSCATSDDRFAPLAPGEIDSAAFEVSVLDAPRTLDSPSRLVPGLHGIIVTNRARCGVLLPRVAAERGFSTEEFLDAGCRKAGLPPGRWRQPPTVVEIFTAEVFGDPALRP